MGLFAVLTQDTCKRDLGICKETHVDEKKRDYSKRDVYIWKRDVYIWKETCVHANKPMYMKRDQYVFKEIYTKSFPEETSRRDLLPCAKRCQKRPIYMKKDL